MAVCHSAVTDVHKKTKGNLLRSKANIEIKLIHSTAELIYKASSPDEEALCRAAKDNGIIFLNRSNQAITIQVGGKSKSFMSVHVLFSENDHFLHRSLISISSTVPYGIYL